MINEIEIKKGSKKTKRGWIPDEWEEKKFSEIAQIKVGRDLKEESYSPIKTIKHIYPVYSNTVDNLGFYGFYDFAEYEGESLTIVGRGAGLGRAFCREGCFGAIGRLLIVFPNKNHNAKYITEYTNFKLNFHSESSGIPQLTGMQLSSFSIVLPTLPEQQKIARILSSWDKGITKLEQLISQKQLLKKGLMQQLLTGKKRFAGFADKWKVVTVEDVFEFLSTNSFSRNDMDYEVGENSIFNIHYGDIHATYHEPILDFEKHKKIPVISKEASLSNKVSYLQDGDLVIADASEDYEGVADSIELKNINGKKVLAGLHTFALRDKSGLTENGFRTYLLKHPKVKNTLKSIATGSKVYGVSKANILKIELIIPSNEEQKKIGEFLSVFDKEIEQLQNQLTKLQEQKKGLMQKLLTGEVRVQLN